MAEARKTVTVVFSDVAGSTSLGERLDPEAVRYVMGRWFAEASVALERHGGTVEKFIGDAVMAVFGIPTLREDDALRAVRAAAELHEGIAQLNEELEAELGVTIALRTGVNTGEVVAGDPAQGQAFATGDAVNVAARLQQTAGPGEIVLGETTFALVRGAVRAEPLEPLELKGKAEPVGALRLLEVFAGAPAFTRRLDAPFVGRGDELTALVSALDEAERESACRLVTVVGTPGIGKSRLIRELLSATKGRAQAVIGRCVSYGEGITYWPLSEIVRQVGGEHPRSVVAKLVGGEDGELVAERVAGAVGLLETTSRTEEVFWATRRLFESLARERPLVVVVDDIHWAEETFLDLLEYVAAFARARVLLLCAARPDLFDARPAWAAPRPGSTLVSLEPLTDAESEELVQGLGAEAGVATHVVEAAEGNPLFLEQLLALETENGHEPGRPATPPTIQALLGARIDRLEESERAVLERASIEGRLFHLGAVAELLPDDRRAVAGSSVLSLVRKELVRPDESLFPGDDGFRFAHILVRDVAYEGIPKEARADLHVLFVRWLERTAGQRTGEYEEILGYHLERAYRYRAELRRIDKEARGLARQAAERLAAGGRRALERGDMPASVKLTDRALSLLPENDPHRLELLLDLGFALFALGEPERAEAVLAEAIALAEAFGEPRLRWRATVLRSHIQMTHHPERRDLEEVLREAQEATAVFEAKGDDVGLARAYFLLVDVCWMKGQAAAAVEAAERAVEHGRRAGSHRDMTEGLELLSWVMLDSPTPVPEGLGRCEELLEGARGDRWTQATLLAWLATHQAMLGRFAEARKNVGRATAITRDLRVQWLEGVTLLLSGYIEMLAGNPVAAEQAMRSAGALFREAGDNWWLSTVMVELPSALYEQGRYDDAFQLTEAFDEVPAPYDLEWQIKRRAVRAKTLARRGQMTEAEDLAHQAVRLAAQTDFLNFHGDALLDLAEVLRMSARPEEASAAVEQAIVLYERKGNVVLARRARERLGQLQVSPSQ